MRLCKVEDLQGGEVLAKSVINKDYSVLLKKYTELCFDYIEKLKLLDIDFVYICEDSFLHTEEVLLLGKDIEDIFSEKIKEILEKHTYNDKKNLSELSNIANQFIDKVMKENRYRFNEKIYDLKEREADIYYHSLNVCTLAILVSMKLGLSKQSIYDIGIACLLHDLGLRYVTVDYKNKSIYNMSKIDASEYKKHPIYGYSVLQNEGWISEMSKSIILNHHERNDGSGFPLKTMHLSLEARIVKVCDALDEMICGIAWERCRVSEAVDYLKEQRGKKFNHLVVDTILSFIAHYPSGSKVVLNTGDTGIVIKQNNKVTDKPVIRIIKDKYNNLIGKELIIDLIKVNNVSIERLA